MPVTNYIWDVVSDNVLMEKDDDDETIARYVQEPGLYGEAISQERDGQTRYYHYDGEGNTSELTDENENVTDTYEYSAFGEEVARTGTTENPFGYKGALGYYANAETGDYAAEARVYQPTLGRWLNSVGLTASRTFDPFAIAYCRAKLNSAIAAGGAYYSYPCASALLRHFLDSTRPAGGCPSECETQLSSFIQNAQPPIRGCAGRYAAQTGGSCGQGEVFKYHLTGSSSFAPGNVDRDIDEDLFFALHDFNWESKGTCLGSCTEPQTDCCCDCKAHCIHTVIVTDTYDFCSSCGRTDPRYSLCWCACYFEDTGRGKKFDIECEIKHRTKEKWRQCGGKERNVLNPPKFDCSKPEES